MSNSKNESSHHLTTETEKEKTTHTNEDIESKGLVLAFSNDKEFIPEENNSAENEDTGNHDNLNPDSNMSIDFDDQDEDDLERSNRLIFHSIVVDKLFPRIKFLDKCNDLEFSNKNGTICHFIFNKCGLQYDEKEQVSLWQSAKKWIMTSIARLRCNRCSAIRNEFYSK